MYEPGQRRVLDFYADLVRPMLELYAAAPDGVVFGRNGLLNGTVASFSDRNYWQQSGGFIIQARPGTTPAAEGDPGGDPVEARVYTLLNVNRDLAGLLMNHATGHALLPAEIPVTLPTLNRQPGRILLPPQLLRIAPDASGRANPDGRPHLPFAYAFHRSIILYSGQHLLAAGPRTSSLPPASLFAVAAAVPLVMAGAGEDQPPAFEIAADATCVVIEGVDLRGFGKSILAAGADFLTGVRLFTGGEVEAADTRMLWLEGADLRTSGQAPSLTIGPGCRDTTSWNSYHATTTVDGSNGQLWFGGLEPQVNLGGISPLDQRGLQVHEVELGGVGCGLFGVHAEGSVQPVTDVLQDAASRRSVVRVREGSSFCHVAATKMTREGFPVLVERDCTAALTRQPIVNKLETQPQFNAGLRNLLTNAGFQTYRHSMLRDHFDLPEWTLGFGVDADHPPLREPGFGPALDEAPIHGQKTSLRLRSKGRGVLLSQLVSPTVLPNLISVADRTFAAGVWVQGVEGATGVRLRLEDVEGGRREESNLSATGSRWQFLSVVLHTSSGCRSVRWSLVSSKQCEVHASEPMFVEGVYLPPFHPRPLTDAGGRVFAPSLTSLSNDSLMLEGRKTARTGGMESIDRQVFVGSPGLLDQALVAIEPATELETLSIVLCVNHVLQATISPSAKCPGSTFAWRPPEALTFKDGDLVEILASLSRLKARRGSDPGVQIAATLLLRREI